MRLSVSRCVLMVSIIVPCVMNARSPMVTAQSGAPISIHWRILAIASSESGGCPLGIRGPLSVGPSKRLYNSDPSGLFGITLT